MKRKNLKLIKELPYCAALYSKRTEIDENYSEMATKMVEWPIARRFSS